MIKKRPDSATYVSITLALCVLCAVPSFPQALVSALPVEPPSSLFSTKLGDADVEVFAQGFWEASVLSTGVATIGAANSGLSAVPFLFTQTPDLYVFLRFRQQWLFEAYVTQNLADAMFSLAFEGDDSTFIRSARLGNAGITLPEYPYMAFGVVPGSFGAMLSAQDVTSDVAVDAMIRWDGLQWKTRTFFGSAEAREDSLAPGDNLRGRRFVLPGAPVLTPTLVDTLSNGEPRTLRSDEYSISLATGVVLLGAEPLGTLTAEYRTSTGADHTETLYAYLINADGVAARQKNPLEARNLYALSDTSEARQLFVRNLATGTTDLRFTVSRVASGLIQVVQNNATPEPASSAYMMPFFEITPWIYDVSHGTDLEYASGEGFSIIARVVESVDTIVLDQETVAGTVLVYRDGVESSSFSYDEQARTLTLVPPPRSGEQVQVRYAVESADRTDGALAFGLGTRFPWLGLGWATAVGGRWPLFGQGWDEGGEVKSAWTGISFGVVKETESLAFSLNAMARYLRAGSTGLYRIASMEDGSLSDILIPFRAVDGDIDGMLPSVSEEDGPGAEPAFKALMTNLHPASAVNRLLHLSVNDTASGERGAATRFVRYVDPVPLSTYQRLSFFLKADAVTTGANLELLVGDGEGKGARVSVPLDILDPGWHQFVFDLGPAGVVTVYAGDGSTITVPGVTGTYSVPGSAGLVELVVTGLTEGSIGIDELLLQEAYDGFAALADASFAVGDRSKKEGPYLLGTGSGVVDSDPALAANIQAGWVARYAEFAVNWSPSFASDAASYGLGYVLALPGRTDPTRVVDQFSRDVQRGLYARSLEAVLAAGSFTALAKAGSTEESSRLRQSWAGTLGLSSLASVSATAGLDASESVVSSLDFIDSWTESWMLMVPNAEAEADSRSMELSASLLGSSLTAVAKRSIERSTGALNSAEARLSVPLKLGAFSLEPFYARSSSLESFSASSSFETDLADFATIAARATRLWSSIPFTEFWTDDVFASFTGFVAGAVAADHSAELGLGFRRPIGYGIFDLFAPSDALVGFSRTISMKDDTMVESSMLSVSVSSGAANVFAARGANPLLPEIFFDEYSHKATVSFSYYPSDGEILPSLASNVVVSMESLSGSIFALTSNLAYERTRSTEPWSEALGLALSTCPQRTWLGDLAGLAIQKRKRAEVDAGSVAEKTWVSAWFDAILADPFSLRDSYALEGSVGRTSTKDAPLVARAKFDYKTRVVAGGSLTIGFGAGHWQSISIADASTVWEFGYTLSVEAKVVF